MADRRSRAPLAGLALVAAMALAGCGAGTPTAGVAARVGDEIITVDDVQERAELIMDLGARGQGQAPEPSAEQVSNLQRGIIEQAILVQLVERLAEEEGVEVTDAELAKEVQVTKQQYQQQGQSAPPEELLRESARLQTVFTKLQTAIIGGPPRNQEQQTKFNETFESRMSKLARELGIEINPRYGAWDYDAKFLGSQQGAIEADGGQLVKVQRPEPAQPELPLPQGQ